MKNLFTLLIVILLLVGKTFSQTDKVTHKLSYREDLVDAVAIQNGGFVCKTGKYYKKSIQNLKLHRYNKNMKKMWTIELEEPEHHNSTNFFVTSEQTNVTYYFQKSKESYNYQYLLYRIDSAGNYTTQKVATSVTSKSSNIVAIYADEESLYFISHKVEKTSAQNDKNEKFKNTIYLDRIDNNDTTIVSSFIEIDGKGKVNYLGNSYGSIYLCRTLNEEESTFLTTSLIEINTLGDLVDIKEISIELGERIAGIPIQRSSDGTKIFDDEGMIFLSDAILKLFEQINISFDFKILFNSTGSAVIDFETERFFVFGITLDSKASNIKGFYIIEYDLNGNEISYQVDNFPEELINKNSKLFSGNISGITSIFNKVDSSTFSLQLFYNNGIISTLIFSKDEILTSVTRTIPQKQFYYTTKHRRFQANLIASTYDASTEYVEKIASINKLRTKRVSYTALRNGKNRILIVNRSLTSKSNITFEYYEY